MRRTENSPRLASAIMASSPGRLCLAARDSSVAVFTDDLEASLRRQFSEVVDLRLNSLFRSAYTLAVNGCFFHSLVPPLSRILFVRDEDLRYQYVLS